MDKKSEWIIKELKILEDQKRWDDCIYFFKKNLKELKNKKYLYISINYFFMNLLLEEQDFSGKIKFNELYDLSIKYFNQSYKLFKNDPEYLYFTGKITIQAPWYFNIDYDNFSEKMINKAVKMKPYSYISKMEYFSEIKWSGLKKHKKQLEIFSLKYLKKDSKIITELKKLGYFGEYFIEITFRHFL